MDHTQTMYHHLLTTYHLYGPHKDNDAYIYAQIYYFSYVRFKHGNWRTNSRE